MKLRLTFFHPLIPAVLLALWFSGLWFVSSLPGDRVRLPSFDFADKVLHFGYFLVGGFLLAWLLRPWRAWPSLRIWLVATALMAAVGAVDEWHQTRTPGRSGGDHGDWLADAAGGSAGAGIFLIIYGLVTRRTYSPTPAGN